jgi:predicted DNA-binding transcriptional regulator YafY
VPTVAMRRADLRVLRVIKCLRLLERSCYSADDLAGHFRVSKRTVYRDLHLLGRAGVMLVKRTDDRRYFAPAEMQGAQRSSPRAE